MEFGFFYMEMEARFFLLFISAGASGQGLTLSVFCKTENGRTYPSTNSGLMCFCTVEEAVAPHCSLDVAAHLLAMEGSAVTLDSVRAP